LLIAVVCFVSGGITPGTDPRAAELKATYTIATKTAKNLVILQGNQIVVKIQLNNNHVIVINAKYFTSAGDKKTSHLAAQMHINSIMDQICNTGA